MLEKEAREELEKQHYALVGNHSAVKICGWTKKAVRGEGVCYKEKFYGISCLQCMQMSTCLSCASRCIFCWRGYKAPVSKEWCWKTDDPQFIFDESVKAQKKQLVGFGGNEVVDKNVLEKAYDIKNVALSLTGEPILYPRLNEFIEICNKKGIRSFVVTNGQYPEAIERLTDVTQLYMSLDAPNSEIARNIDAPLFKDHWERTLKSLDFLSEKKGRTAIRLTLVKGINMLDEEGYVELIKRGDPDFIEVKGYMFVGASRQRLKIENMPYHNEVKEFAEKINKLLDDYEIIDEQESSRVVLLAKKKYKRDAKIKDNKE